MGVSVSVGVGVGKVVGVGAGAGGSGDGGLEVCIFHVPWVGLHVPCSDARELAHAGK